jgi:hypothetical protein
MVTKRIILSKTFTLGNWKFREDTLPDGTKLTFFNGMVSIKLDEVAMQRQAAMDRIDRIVEEDAARNVIPGFLTAFTKGGVYNE